MPAQATSIFKITNIRMFIALRVLYNARFYYPVFTVLFLDYGLTIEQFAMLNVVWAATIVLFEVPSGALADIFGRKALLLCTSVIMIFELLLISFVPVGNPNLVFYVFLINRILSGFSEAMASGADEAIAYDSLVEHQLQAKWPDVLEVQMKVQSAGFIVAMMVGAMVYDPHLMNQLLSLFHIDYQLTQQISMRFPLLLTLLSSFAALAVVLSMDEPLTNQRKKQKTHLWQTISDSTRHILSSGQWIARTPFALVVILFAMLYDHVIRLIITLTSQYYRLFEIPDSLFGVIGAGMAVIGFFIPKMANKMTAIFSARTNIFIMATGMFFGCLGLSRFWPWFGVLPMVLIFIVFMLNGFFTSHYLNEITPSEIRATVLSFKGLSFNFSYGLIGFLFSILYAAQKGKLQESLDVSTAVQIENLAFINVTGWFQWYFLVFFVVVLIFSFFILRYRRGVSQG
ncbi:MAG: MFS transporter [Desulfuromusa sp.]|nr:MFS transporter [Desulfuromusa sp.]